MRPDEIDNPAWDYIKNVPEEKWPLGQAGVFSPAGFEYDGSDVTTMRSHRHRATTLWAWAIPDPEVLEYLLEGDGLLLKNGIVEIGAGNGYWAYLLSQLGVSVNAYDIAPIGHPESWFNPDPESDYKKAIVEDAKEALGESPKEWHPVAKGGVEVLDLPENHDRVLFLCWPPYDQPMAYEAAKRFKGTYIIYIGEDMGGCNADDAFFELMGASWRDEADTSKAEWEEFGRHRVIQWSGLHDILTIYRRKS